MSTSAARAAGHDRLLGIEAIRFVSAVAVLFWHYQHFWFVADEAVAFSRESQPFYTLFAFLYSFGNYGVEVFWCLSGFVFFWKYSESIQSGAVTAYQFFVLRFSRLYPLHLVTLLVVAAVQPVYRSLVGSSFVYQENDVPHFIAQLLLATDWGLIHGYSFNGPIWSVSVEAFIYGLFFALMRSLGGSLTVTLALTAAFAIGHASDTLPYHLSKGLVFFFLGGVTAHVYALGIRDRRVGAVADVSAVAVLVACTSLMVSARLQWTEAPHPTILLLGACPAVIVLTVRYVRLTGATSRIVTDAGNLTYSSYLLHFPIQLLIVTASRMLDVSIPAQSPIFLISFVAGTLLLSRLIYKQFEMPAQRLIRARLLTQPE